MSYKINIRLFNNEKKYILLGQTTLASAQLDEQTGALTSTRQSKMLFSVPLQFKPVNKVIPCSSSFHEEETAIEPIAQIYA